MDTKKKKSRAPNSTSQVRKAFYEQATRLTGFSEERCREILIGAFGESFDQTKIKDYLELLKLHAEDERTKAALANMRDKLRNKLYVAPLPNPCPIPGCPGFIVSGKPWRWVCSIGGLRHYLVAVAANCSGVAPDVMLEKVTARAKEREIELQQEYSAWQKGVSIPYEAKAWHIIKEDEDITETAIAFATTDA